MSAPQLTALTRQELTAFFERNALNAHQARLFFQAIHRHNARALSDISEISSACRKFLETQLPLPSLTLDTVHRSTDGTLKLRILIPGGTAIESVIIPSPRRITLCVSSQAGCAAGCTFCHTATMGLLRNLEAWEIIEQYRLAKQVWDQENSAQGRTAFLPITNLVFMGMGEPLHNEAHVTQACRILGEKLGAGSPRHLVVSTAGVGSRIQPFWELNVGVLAVSLHATTDEVRDQIVPLNRQCNLTELRRILQAIPWRHRESLTIAYLLLEGVNDSQDDARRLADWTRGLPAKINLLEFNPFPGSAFKRSSPERMSAFRQWLYDHGIFNTLRHSRGADAMAACGQLASEKKKTRLSSKI